MPTPKLCRFSTHSALVLLVASVTASCFAADTRNPAIGRIDPDAMRDTVQRLAKEMLVPGAVVILHTPNGDFKTTYGVNTYRGKTPTSFEQHVRVGSNTKTWTATVILQLVQEGRVRLQDPVSKYRPEVPNGTNITIEQLLTMRSGLYNYSEGFELSSAMDANPDSAWTPEQLLAISFKRPPLFPPGTKFSYSNTNTILLGLIAEKVEGRRLAEIMRDRLFIPLGLRQTFLPPINASQLPEPYTHGYMYGTNVLYSQNPALPDSIQAAARAGTIAPNDWMNANASWAWAAGEGISTANELSVWVRALVSGTLLKPEMQRRRLASVKPTDPADKSSPSYGWGIARFGKLYGHTGEMPGFNTFMAFDPVNNVTLVVWTNLAPAVDGRDPASTIARALVGMIYPVTR